MSKRRAWYGAGGYGSDPYGWITEIIVEPPPEDWWGTQVFNFGSGESQSLHLTAGKDEWMFSVGDRVSQFIVIEEIRTVDAHVNLRELLDAKVCAYYRDAILSTHIGEDGKVLICQQYAKKRVTVGQDGTVIIRYLPIDIAHAELAIMQDPATTLNLHKDGSKSVLIGRDAQVDLGGLHAEVELDIGPDASLYFELGAYVTEQE